jgi:hypothetical protein
VFFQVPQYNFLMNGYLSNYSAAKLWNIPYYEVVFGSENDEVNMIEYTVSKNSSRYIKKKCKISISELDLPTNAVVQKNGMMVASPELVFLQLAGRLDIQRLILLGLQLCSYPPGKPSMAITSKQKLEKFLAKTSGHHGHRKAVQGVNYIENGSASIMESIAYMILNLPNFLGGFGLAGATLNHEIMLKEEVAKGFGQKRCFADLYYKSVKLAVEYESFAFHNSPTEQGKDMVRAAILERQGIEVLRLSTIQLYDEEACWIFASNLASRIGKRIRIRSKKFHQMHASLRSLLPTGKQDSIL